MKIKYINFFNDIIAFEIKKIDQDQVIKIIIILISYNFNSIKNIK